MLSITSQTEKDKNHIMDLTHVYNIKEMNKQNKNSQIQTTDWWLSEGKGVDGRMKWVKVVKYVVMNGNQTFGDEDIIVYIDIKL